ncbi:helix-turn-helix domain-containing protein [Galbibacter sp. BG1]
MARGELNIMRKFGQFVKFKRRQKGLTQSELAQLVYGKNDRQYISKIENNKVEGINLSTMETFLEVLDADMDFKSL